MERNTVPWVEEFLLPKNLVIRDLGFFSFLERQLVEIGVVRVLELIVQFVELDLWNAQWLWSLVHLLLQKLKSVGLGAEGKPCYLGDLEIARQHEVLAKKVILLHLVCIAQMSRLRVQPECDSLAFLGIIKWKLSGADSFVQLINAPTEILVAMQFLSVYFAHQRFLLFDEVDVVSVVFHETVACV